MPSARRVVAISLLVDVVDVVTCLTVALITGSAVVFAGMAMGIADVAGSLLLVVGERRARRPASVAHPLGHRREAFFWALLSALALVVLGGGLSLERGIGQLLHPEPLRAPGLALAVLALSVLTNGYSVQLAVRKLASEEGSLREAFREPLRPLVKTALLRDTVGTASAVLGLVAVGSALAFGSVLFDALGALLVAAAAILLGLYLVAETRALIAGRSIPAADRAHLAQLVRATPGVAALNGLIAVYSGGKEVEVVLDLDLAEELDTPRIEHLLDDLQRRIRVELPETQSLRVDLNSPATGSRQWVAPAGSERGSLSVASASEQ